jgi:hypothetical protein
MPRTRTSTRIAAAVAAAAVGLALAAPDPGSAAAVQPQKGTYGGKTSQRSVDTSFRRIEFKVNGKRTRITLTVEPVVARNFCVSSPVFLAEAATVRTKLRRGRFAFTETFVGSKFNRIAGRFVSPTEIEGEATYWFAESDAGLCGAGSTTTRFSAEK